MTRDGKGLKGMGEAEAGVAFLSASACVPPPPTMRNLRPCLQGGEIGKGKPRKRAGPLAFLVAPKSSRMAVPGWLRPYSNIPNPLTTPKSKGIMECKGESGGGSKDGEGVKAGTRRRSSKGGEWGSEGNKGSTMGPDFRWGTGTGSEGGGKGKEKGNEALISEGSTGSGCHRMPSKGVRGIADGEGEAKYHPRDLLGNRTQPGNGVRGGLHAAYADPIPTFPGEVSPFDPPGNISEESDKRSR